MDHRFPRVCCWSRLLLLHNVILHLCSRIFFVSHKAIRLNNSHAQFAIYAFAAYVAFTIYLFNFVIKRTCPTVEEHTTTREIYRVAQKK